MCLGVKWRHTEDDCYAMISLTLTYIVGIKM